MPESDLIRNTCTQKKHRHNHFHPVSSIAMEIPSIAFTVSVCIWFIFIWFMANNNNCEIKTNNTEIKKRERREKKNCDRWGKVLLIWFDYVDFFFSVLVVCFFVNQRALAAFFFFSCVYLVRFYVSSS